MHVLPVDNYWSLRCDFWARRDVPDSKPFQSATVTPVPFLLFEKVGSILRVKPVDVEHVLIGTSVRTYEQEVFWTRSFPDVAAVVTAVEQWICQDCGSEQVLVDGTVDDFGCLDVSLYHDTTCEQWLDSSVGRTWAKRQEDQVVQASALMGLADRVEAELAEDAPIKPRPRRKRKRKRKQGPPAPNSQPVTGAKGR
jgi:hypothetical protein